ncbi:MAG: tetratricopeptide repeat protein [Spirochaetales bacterium]|nr:tetratricopeptide repeat protein [Spirochaetales bacterium]
MKFFIRNLFIVSLCFFLFPMTGQSEGISSAVRLYGEGRALQDQDNYYSAIERYRQALEMNPSYVQALRGLAECYFFLDEPEESLVWVRKTSAFVKDDPDIMNLEARILIGLGQLGEAEKLFRAILEIQPNNLGALFGYAELDIVTGKVENAARRYEDALRISPENRQAILSLVMVYDNLGMTDKAEYFAKRALQIHADNFKVHYVVGRHYFRKGDLTTAEYHAKSSLQMDPENNETLILLSDIYLQTGRYEEVLDLGTTVLKTDRKNHIIWYILGLASWKLGQYQEARYYLNEAVHLQSDDDLARIAMEQLLIEHFPMEDTHRQEAAEYHFIAGQRYSDKNMLPAALREYRRGLMLNPLSEEGRWAYGKIFKDAGNVAKYVSVLEVLIKEGTKNRAILDEYEIYSSLLPGSVAFEWEIDQFSHPRDLYLLSVFYTRDQGGTGHPEGAAFLGRYAGDLLFARESLEPLRERPVKDFAEAFRTARQDGSDYFVILTFREIDRIVSLLIQCYRSETGTLVMETHILRTGNGRIPAAFTEGASRIASMLIPRGRLIDRSFNQGLMDLGTADGVASGDEFYILRRGSLQMAPDGLNFNYAESDILGVFTVTETDYLVSQGTIQRKGFFDMINQHDHLVPALSDELPDPGTEPPGNMDLYKMLLRLQ